MKFCKRFTSLLLSAILLSALIFPICAYAEEQAPEKTIRVGWHEAPYFIIDENGRRSGYSYEYQWKVAAYTGWDYEYVEGSWSDLLQMLKNGEIDMMSNISYTEERAKDLLYASLPMGTEAYYLFISPDNTEIIAEDFASLDGKTVGVTQNSIQTDLFRDWADKHGIEVNLVEINGPDEESLKMLDTELDAFVTMDVYGDSDSAVPVWKIGSSDFYFAVSKDRPDLLTELDFAMSRIQDENKYYDQELHEKYLRNEENDLYLNLDERVWLFNHGTIRVGYQDNYLAFCASDPETGELTGALKDFLAYASNALENAHLDFEAISYPTAAAAMEAMENGEVDCMFPANLTDYDSEELSVVMSPTLMNTEMDAVVRAADQKEFIRKEDVTVAVNEGNPNYELFLAEHYPGWKIAYYKDTPAALDAVAAGEADCVIISNYRFSNISKQCDKLRLTTVYTGVDMDYCFAVPKGETLLYSILARVANAVPDATIHTALTYYSTEDVKTSFTDLIKDNLFIVMTVIAVILLVIIVLLLRSIRAEKKIIEEEHLVSDLNKRVFVDPLTSVRNKGAFTNAVDEIQDMLNQGLSPEFAIGIFDCDNLKTINDRYGHDRGDIYIKGASRLICRTFQHSPVFRIGGDEFAVILKNEDFENREELITLFEKTREELCEAADNKWEEPRVAIGIAVYDPEIDASVDDTVHRADKIMYENKRVSKSMR